jgi:ribonuclease HII
MERNIVSAQLIDDSDNEEVVVKKKRQRKPVVLLKSCFNTDEHVIEIGVDEAGRGPLFGRVYTAAVILPKDDSFDYSKVKDSKKFSSKKKIDEAAEYVKNHSLAWSVTYADETIIDNINILQATQQSMHDSIKDVMRQYKNKYDCNHEFSLLIDGDYFNPITLVNKTTNRIDTIPYMTIKGGDNTYASIAAASILAKVERDKYIDELCNEYPELSEKYAINTNKGYGAKKHLDGIKEHGITIWHRRSFAPCKFYV